MYDELDTIEANQIIQKGLYFCQVLFRNIFISPLSILSVLCYNTTISIEKRDYYERRK